MAKYKDIRRDYENPEEKKYVLKVLVPMRRRGMSLRKIANEIGRDDISYETVRKLLIKYGQYSA